MQIHVSAAAFREPEPLAVQIARTKRQLAADQFWMSLSVGLVYCLIALVTFGPKFIGGLTECVSIMLWGFGLDFTMDAALKSIPKKS
jgi:hypothetical protein